MGQVVPLHQPDQPEEILTRGELAVRLKVSVRTIDRWVGIGLPSELWGPRTRRFRLREVDRWLKRRAA